MLNFMDLARSGDQVIGVHLEMKRVGICPSLLRSCFSTVLRRLIKRGGEEISHSQKNQQDFNCFRSGTI